MLCYLKQIQVSSFSYSILVFVSFKEFYESCNISSVKFIDLFRCWGIVLVYFYRWTN